MHFGVGHESVRSLHYLHLLQEWILLLLLVHDVLVHVALLFRVTPLQVVLSVVEEVVLWTHLDILRGGVLVETTFHGRQFVWSSGALPSWVASLLTPVVAFIL